MAATASRMQHYGVTNPVAPQGLVVQNAVLYPNLLQIRTQQARPRYPMLNGPMDLAARRGEWAFTLRDPVRAFYTNRPNQDDLAVFTSANGMMGDEPVMFLGRIDTPDEVSASGDSFAHAELGCVVRRSGPASGTNTGPAPIPAGALVYWDWPVTSRGADGRDEPFFHVKGNQTKFWFSTKALNTGSAEVYLMSVWNEMVADMFTPSGQPAVKILKAAQRKHRLFEGIETHRDPVLRFINFLESRLPAATTEQLPTLIYDDADMMTAFMNTVVNHSAAQVEAMNAVVPQAIPDTSSPQYIDRLLAKMSDPDEKKWYKSRMPLVTNLFFVPRFMTEIQQLIDSRYMGKAMSAANAGHQLDLLLG